MALFLIKMIQKITLIGSGNVATNLAIHFHDSGIIINGIHSKNKDHGSVLADRVSSISIEKIEELPKSDLIILAVPDYEINTLIEQLPVNSKIAYTAGSVRLKNRLDKTVGVLYPLQTFTKNKIIDRDSIPFLIESFDISFEDELEKLALIISKSVTRVNTIQRQELHLNATMINNFTNHLVYLSQNRLKNSELDWKLFMPLLNETIEKLNNTSAFENQTGPARRNDMETINNHLSLLNNKEKELYELLTSSILKTYAHEKL